MNVKKLLTGLLIIAFQFNLFGFLATTEALAQNNPPVKTIPGSIYSLNSQINDLKASANHISGQLVVQNEGDNYLAQVYYTIKLSAPDSNKLQKINGAPITVFQSGKLVAFENSHSFSLSAKETKQFSLDLPVSPNIPAGKYKLEVTYSDDNDRLLNTSTATIDATGKGAFLDVGDCSIVTDNVEYTPTLGPNVAPQGEVFGKCQITNNSSGAISATTSTTYSQYGVLGYIQNPKKTFDSADVISFAPKESKSVNIPLPKLDTPQVYAGLSAFVDANGSTVSPFIPFRWTISGQSANVRSITLDKTSYLKGEVATVSVAADPSMDLYWRGSGPAKILPIGTDSASLNIITPKLQGTPLTNPNILTTIKDFSGQVCGTKTQKVDADPNINTWPVQTVSVNITRDCNNPTVEAAVFDGDKQLAVKSINYQSQPATEAGKLQLASQKDNFLIIVGAALTIIIIACLSILWFLWGSKKGKPPGPPLSSPNIPQVPIAVLIILLVIAILYYKNYSGSSFKVPQLEVPSAKASIGIGPNSTPISVNYHGGYSAITARSTDKLCKTPTLITHNDPVLGCVGDILGAPDDVDFTFTDPNLITLNYNLNTYDTTITGKLYGYGCANTLAGLIVRAYIDGSASGVSINGGAAKLTTGDIASVGSGTTNVSVPVSVGNGQPLCGTHTLDLQLVPFIHHLGIVASDPAESQLLTSYGNWNIVDYNNLSACGSPGGSCYGIIHKTISNTCGSVTIRGTAFSDNDRNIDMSPGDVVLPNQPVQLYSVSDCSQGQSGGTFIGQFNTTSNGEYAFVLNTVGSYAVRYAGPPPANYTPQHTFSCVRLKRDGSGNLIIDSSGHSND